MPESRISHVAAKKLNCFDKASYLLVFSWKQFKGISLLNTGIFFFYFIYFFSFFQCTTEISH